MVNLLQTVMKLSVASGHGMQNFIAIATEETPPITQLSHHTWVTVVSTSQRWRRVATSIPEVGSSRRMIDGLPTRAIPVLNLRLLPPLREGGKEKGREERGGREREGGGGGRRREGGREE